MKIQVSANFRRSFSLIEVLAAMTILSIMIILLGRLFSDSVEAYHFGSDRLDLDGSARSVLDFMASEIGSAITDTNLFFYVQSDSITNHIGLRSDSLRFVTLRNKPERRIFYSQSDKSWITNYYRASQLVAYYMTFSNGLWRRGPENYNTTNSLLALAHIGSNTWISQLSLTTNFFDANVLTPDAVRLKFEVGTIMNGSIMIMTNYDSRTSIQNPPRWVDIYLELMSPRDQSQAALLGGVSNHITKIRRYSRRVFLDNRQNPLNW